MKTHLISLNSRSGLLLAAGIGFFMTGGADALAHGPGHVHRSAQSEVNEALDLEPGAAAGTGAAPAARASTGGKSFETPLESAERSWGASLATGWESRHVHYGVDETGPGGACTTELSVWIHNFTLSAWSGFGTGNEFEEWDFTAAYNLDLGPVFVIPGYNLRYTPGIIEEGHEEEHEDHHAGHGEEHAEEGHDHTHNLYGNELFLVLGTNAIPYVTPAAMLIWDLNNTPGAYMEFRIDGELPVYKDILSLQPYALLGLNLGYNTRAYYGWNNFQFGLEAVWQINPIVSVFGGVNYSIAMTALREIDQENVVWANVGVRFTY